MRSSPVTDTSPMGPVYRPPPTSARWLVVLPLPLRRCATRPTRARHPAASRRRSSTTRSPSPYRRSTSPTGPRSPRRTVSGSCLAREAWTRTASSAVSRTKAMASGPAATNRRPPCCSASVRRRSEISSRYVASRSWSHVDSSHGNGWRADVAVGPVHPDLVAGEDRRHPGHGHQESDPDPLVTSGHRHVDEPDGVVAVEQRHARAHRSPRHAGGERAERIGEPARRRSAGARPGRRAGGAPPARRATASSTPAA